ncbi:MAG: hypothetical protein PW792_03090 [Acidobacteriaceae bacterium]|nr:hypothetical protein [Acidobacteriaceae bacterium]
MLRKIFPAIGLVFLLTGCHSSSIPTPQSEQAKADAQAIVDSQRSELAMIPPPSKSRFMAIHSMESWQNPSITVQASMLELRVTLADANPSPIGVGGITRPIGARKQELNISFDKLGEAVSSIPESAWPYGRVIALEEAHKVPASAEPTVRRSMERAIDKLTDLGIVVYDPEEGNIR